MVTAFRGRDKDIVNAKFDNRKLKGFKHTMDDYLNYLNSQRCHMSLRMGKPFIYDLQLAEGPWKLIRWHEWYMKASTIKGISSFTVSVGENLSGAGHVYFKSISPICIPSSIGRGWTPI